MRSFGNVKRHTSSATNSLDEKAGGVGGISGVMAACCFDMFSNLVLIVLVSLYIIIKNPIMNDIMLIEGRHKIIMNGDRPMFNSDGNLLVQDIQGKLLLKINFLMIKDIFDD